MTNESLGLRLLNKLDRLSQGYHIYEEDELENDGTAEDAAEEMGETSEALRKLRGHLYRFQENDTKKAVAAGAVGGAVAGNLLAKRAAKKAYGLEGATKKYAVKGAEASKNVTHFANKAVAKDAMAKAAKAAGEKGASAEFARSAAASAGAAEKAAKGAKGFGKAVKELGKPIKSAGFKGGLKGAAIGAGAAYLGKKAYDYFKK